MLSFIVFLAIFIPVTAASANDEGVIVFHYQRHNEDYRDWGLWLWPSGHEGSAYEFEEADELGVKAYIDLNEFDLKEATELGFIVRQGDWEDKDVDEDRFVDLTRMVDGELHIYLVEGEVAIYYDDDAIDLSPNLVSSTFESLTEIRLETSVPIEDAEGVEVRTGSDEPVEIREVVVENRSTLRVVLEDEIVLEETYFIMKDGFKEEIQVSLSGLFDSEAFHEAFYYDGNDLGFVYSPTETTFRVWAPTASHVVLNLYEEGSGDNLIAAIPTSRDEKGTWIATVEGDLNLTYYTYEVTVYGRTQEAVDPYARAVGVNGRRGMVIDLETTNPEGWGNSRPDFSGNLTDAVIYELHMRDWSSHESSDIEHVGQFLQFTEPGATDHMTALGITHLHLLPVFSFSSIDETRLDEPQFNWGYDPLNYNAPQGSYSTDPTRGEIRINEFKQMVQSLHDNGIRVVMDVVYNHTGPTADSDFNKIVPGYYYRQDAYGNFSDGSGCGNETASDRGMMRRFIVDSVVYWATEYQVDGFRFDLMALHDVDTMNEVRAVLDEIDPTIMIYGEGWDAGGSALDPDLAASKVNAGLVPGIAMFNDDLRDGVKGSVFVEEEPGFVNGNFSFAERVKFGIVGAVWHPQIDYQLVGQAGGSSEPWAIDAAQSVNYVSAHDNHTLFDKLRLTLPDTDFETIKAMQKQSNAIVLTAQGVPFLHAGVEMMRTKDFDHNSYQSPDEVNQLNWNWLDEHQDVFEYYQGLIALRAAHPAFRMSEQEDIEEHLTFMEDVEVGVIGFHLSDYANGDSVSDIVVVHNVTEETQEISLPISGTWNVVVNDEAAGVETLAVIKGSSMSVNPHSSYVLMADTGLEEERSLLPILIGAGIIGVAALVGYRVSKKNQNKG